MGNVSTRLWQRLLIVSRTKHVSHHSDAASNTMIPNVSTATLVDNLVHPSTKSLSNKTPTRTIYTKL